MEGINFHWCMWYVMGVVDGNSPRETIMNVNVAVTVEVVHKHTHHTCDYTPTELALFYMYTFPSKQLFTPIIIITSIII